MIALSIFQALRVNLPIQPPFDPPRRGGTGSLLLPRVADDPMCRKGG